MTIKDTLIASLVPIFLGFGFVIAKPAFESFPPILLMGIRFSLAALLLIWWFPIPKGYLKKIFFASLIANTLQYSITYTGLNYIDAAKVNLKPIKRIGGKSSIAGLAITKPNPKNIGTKDAINVSLIVKN